MSQQATPKLNNRNIEREMSLALLRCQTRMSCGTNERVVQTAATEPMESMIQRGRRLIVDMAYGFLQKNQAAMARPMKTTRPRSTDCGIIRAKRAEV